MKELIRPEDEKNAQLEYVLPGAVKFNLPWAEFEIGTSRFSATTAQESCFEALRDLVLGIFKFLKETPIRSLGVNHVYTYGLPDRETYYSVGTKLVPLANWSSFMNDPKMLQLEIIEEVRKDGYDGYYRINIQPAEASLAINLGVTININDHITLKKDETGRKGELLKFLVSNWDMSVTRANAIPNQIWEKVTL